MAWHVSEAVKTPFGFTFRVQRASVMNPARAMGSAPLAEPHRPAAERAKLTCGDLPL